MDLHIPPTWLPILGCDPPVTLPVNTFYYIFAKKKKGTKVNRKLTMLIVFFLWVDSNGKDAVIIPIWVPGHFSLCVS